MTDNILSNQNGNADNNASNNEVRPSQTRSDQVHPSPTEPDLVRQNHWITLDEVEKLFSAEGLIRTRTLLARYCRQERLRGVKDAGPNGDEWYVDPASVPRAIAELKRINKNGERQTETVSVRPGQAPDSQTNSDADKSAKEVTPDKRDGQSDQVRPGQAQSDLTIYEHPAYKRLERDMEYWKDEYKHQVKETQRIQSQSFDKLVELQRMVQVGQSRTLADFFLKAKNAILGEPDPTDRSDVDKSDRP